MNTVFRAALAAVFTLALPAVASAACPSYAVSGAPLAYDAEQVWTAQSTQVVAGGDIDLGQCGDMPGNGYVVENPDFTLQYDDLGMGRALELRVSASCDTVLLVNTASGEWLFNDDTNGSDPAIRIPAAPSGQYDIWVGTFGPETCDAELSVESF